MQFSYVVKLAESYSTLALTAALAAVLVMVFSAFVYYKFFKHEEKELPWTNFVAVGMVVFYLTIVYCATMLNRGHYSSGMAQLGVFETYKNAWYSVDMVEWRNLVLNIMMFVPIGFLLPFTLKLFRRPWATYLFGILCTLSIETLQYTFRCGVFQVDDLINNSLGAMIGYGGFRIVILFKNIILSRKKHWAVTLLSQLPLLVVGLCYGVLVCLYFTQHYGNMKYEQMKSYDVSGITFSSDENFDDSKNTAYVRKQEQYDRSEVFKIASHALAGVGFDINPEDCHFYDTKATCYAVDRQAVVWVEYTSGIYTLQNYTQYKDSHDNDILLNKNASEEEMRKALAVFDIDIPSNAEFSVDESGMYQFDVPIDFTLADDDIRCGTVSCTYTQNGIVQSLQNFMFSMSQEGAVDIITAKEAYDSIIHGKFSEMKWTDNVYYNIHDISYIEIESINLNYTTDSKGYMRPYYLAELKINGQDKGEISLCAEK